MKKIFMILTLAVTGLVSNVAHADAVVIEYGGVEINSGQAKQTGIGMAYRKDVSPMFSGDVAVASLRTDESMGRPSDAVTTRAELGGTIRPMSVGRFTVYDRLAVGVQMGSWRGANSTFNYWSNELGVATRQGKFDARVGYRWRDGDTVGFKTETTRLAVGYSLNKQDRIGLSYDDVRGDFTAKQWGVNYTRSF
jgi:hypothetical protein